MLKRRQEAQQPQGADLVSFTLTGLPLDDSVEPNRLIFYLFYKSLGLSQEV